MLLIATAAASGQLEPLPYHQFTRTATDANVEAGAGFGFSAAAGRLEGIADTHDDVVACAISEDENVDGRPGEESNVGAAYVFTDETLSTTGDPLKDRLLPLGPHGGMQLGRVAVKIGNLRGYTESDPYPNLITLSCIGRNADYPSCSENVPGGGSVEAYDWSAFDFPFPLPDGTPTQISIVAPLNPGPDCASQVPHEVGCFGYQLALADLDRDGVSDLLATAIETDLVDEATGNVEDRLGRLYILRGHPDFMNDPHLDWFGINAPEPMDPAPQTVPATYYNFGQFFGTALATASLTNSPPDVIVGRDDRANKSFHPTRPKGGSVYVLRGWWLYTLLSPSWPDEVIDPPAIDEVDPPLPGQVPEYQVLRNPMGQVQPDTIDPDTLGPLWIDSYGWLVYPAGDVGSPGGGPLDGIADIVVHAQATDFIPGNDPTAPLPSGQKSIGAGYIYFGTGVAGESMVDPEHVLIMTPANLGAPPEKKARPARGLVRLDAWWNELTDQLEPALLIAEPDRTVQGKVNAGWVHLMRLPCPAPAAHPWQPATWNSAWGATPLTIPGGPADHDGFGTVLLALDYLASPSQPGQQIVVTARETSVTVGTWTYLKAGKLFTFVPKPLTP